MRERHSPASDDSPLLVGKNPQKVIDLLQDRAARASRGEQFIDGRKIGLVLEGGAMRAVCSGGGLVALAHMGMTNVFDEVYATSAGVMNASYFLSDQATLGIRVYYEDLVDRRFLNPFRVWKILNVDYVFDHVATIAKPLNVDRLFCSHSIFYVSLMDASTGQGFVVNTRTSETPLLEILRAATAIPVLYNRTVMVDGRPCMDGGICIPFPVEQALANRCTDLLVLMTHSKHYDCPPPDHWSKLLFNCVCGPRSAALRQVYAKTHLQEATARDISFGRASLAAEINIASVCSKDVELVHRSTTNPVLLREGAIEYGREVLRIFKATDSEQWTLPPITA